jgi:hypothetical protein
VGYLHPVDSETKDSSSSALGPTRGRAPVFGLILALVLGLGICGLPFPEAASAQLIDFGGKEGRDRSRVLGPTIEPLRPSDRSKNERQRELVAERTRRHLGIPLHPGQRSDLGILQRLLDSRAVKADDVYAQQALGVVLGDVMVAQMPLEWVSLHDEFGPARALRYRESDQLFFPVTMISKRLANREKVEIRALYEIIEDLVETLERQREIRR